MTTTRLWVHATKATQDHLSDLREFSRRFLRMAEESFDLAPYSTVTTKVRWKEVGSFSGQQVAMLIRRWRPVGAPIFDIADVHPTIVILCEKYPALQDDFLRIDPVQADVLSNLPGGLMEAFVWENTPQGHDFWAKMARLYDGDGLK